MLEDLEKCLCIALEDEVDGCVERIGAHLGAPGCEDGVGGLEDGRARAKRRDEIRPGGGEVLLRDEGHGLGDLRAQGLFGGACEGDHGEDKVVIVR